MSRRRYKIALRPAYDAEFDRRKGGSEILNHKYGRGNVTLAFWSESGVRKLLAEWEGTEDGLFDGGGRYWEVSRLKAAQEAVAAVDEKFELMVVRATRAGRYPPTEPPPELVEEKLILEARLDVIGEEIDYMRKELARYAFKEKEQEDHLILAQGPQGSTWGSDPPRSVDGQKVEWKEEIGHFVICCEKSPYHGVILPAYYAQVVRPWLDSKNKAYKEANAKANDLASTEGSRKKWAEEAHALVTGRKSPPWPPRPEGL